jgi:RNA polymerase sigma-70 factor (ECF subfamily)
LYHALLGNLYTDIDREIALEHFQKALSLSKSKNDQLAIRKNIEKLKALHAKP